MFIKEFEREGIEQGFRLHLYNRNIKLTELKNAGKRGKTCLQINAWFDDNDFANVKWIIQESTSVIELLENIASNAIFHTDIQQLRGVDVIPAGFEAVIIKNDKCCGSFAYDSFSFSDLTDRHNEPRMIDYGVNKTKIQAAYKWAKANIERLQSLSMDEISRLMRNELGIFGHYYCGMD